MDIAVDIGGTFTDVVGRDGAGEWATKVPSVPGDLAGGVVAGVEALLAASGRGAGDVRRFVHGTTIATNAILEQKGARIGLLATAEFEDVLELGRQKRSRMYDLMMDPETPSFLAPGRRRVGIPERVDAAGTVVVPLDEAAVAAAVERLVEDEGVEALAVCYLFSFRNPDHERRTAAIAAARYPKLRVSLSCEVDPVFREYERTCVTAFDAYVRPVVSRYLERLESRLAALGVGAPVLVMQSRGGIASGRRTAARPVSTLLSGPAAGVLGAHASGRRSTDADLVTLDMGGTSADVSVTRSGRVEITREARLRGFPLRVPTIDIHTVGAGGGSIARVDAAGVLKVGPESAGADPGPACYGRGGEAPTVTDASLVLGYVDPAGFAGGLALDRDAAARTIAPLAARLGVSNEEAAYGIHTVCNAAMAEAVRMLTVRRGRDPRRLALVLLGGAGPVHGGRVAEALGVRTLVVPRRPGVLAAEGLLEARIEAEAYRTFDRRAGEVTPADLESELDALRASAAALLAEDGVGVDAGAARVEPCADMRYVGQSYDIAVPVAAPGDGDRVAATVVAFRRRYRELYGHESLVEAVEFVNLRVLLSVPAGHAGSGDAPAPGGDPDTARRGTRRAWFGAGHGWLDTPVYDRTALAAGAAVDGPAILAQADTTTVVYPGHHLVIDTAGNAVIEIPVRDETSGARLAPGHAGHGPTTPPGGAAVSDPPDPITLEVIRNRLDGIAAEVQTTLLRSAYSVILKEGEDCSAGLFNARGEIIAQSTALPQHMGAFIPAMRRLLQAFPVEVAREGDVYVMNDPHDGGTHLPDLIVARPAIVAGRVIGFAVCLAHQEDIGGKVPGSMPTDSTEIFQEGLILPPLKLYDAGAVNPTLVAVIERNVRLPKLVLGDLSAQVSAVTVGARRLAGLFEEYGVETAAGYLDHLLDYAEALTRRHIAAIPDGTYAFTDYMDNDGITTGRRVPIAVTVTVRGSDVRIDFTGTAAQVPGPINAPWSGGAGSAYFAMRCVTDPTIPNNQGCYRPIEVVIPPGTLLNPRHPAPVAIRAHTLKRAADTVLGALVQAVPGRVPAAPAGSISCVSFGGVDPRTGERFGLTDIVAGGGGARPCGDGIELVDTDVSNCMNIPAEAIEMGYPLRVRSYRLRRDGGGPGRNRGGTGVERVLEATGAEIVCSYRSERHFTAPWGLFGGQPGQMWRTDIVRANGTVEGVPSKRAFVLRAGDALHMLTGGGGGYGSPLERPPARVGEDLRDGKISAAQARERYGVVLAEGGEVDAAASAAARAPRRGAATPDPIYDRGFDGDPPEG